MSSNQRVFDAALRYTPVGQHVVVTGGTKGIGRAVVIELATLGAQVFTCARRADDLEGLLDHCKAQDLNVRGVVADVATDEGRRTLVQAVNAAWGGKVDALINNVGTNIRKPTVEYTDNDFQHIFTTNLQSAFRLSSDFHPMLKAAGGGCIVFNSSVAGGPTALKSGSLYAMTKASMDQLARYLACEWAKDEIRVISVKPWYTMTPLAAQVLANKEFENEVLSRTPMGRVAQPEEVARAMCFLLSPAASYITGAALPIDGGYSSMGLF